MSDGRGRRPFLLGDTNIREEFHQQNAAQDCNDQLPKINNKPLRLIKLKR
jgi:hypothetical protein